MAATVITAPELHERPDDYIREKLFEYVPMFRQHMDRGAGDLIGNLESIITHKLYERVGYDSMEAYAREHLNHSEQWCHEVIRIYNREWSPWKQRKGVVSDSARDLLRILRDGIQQEDLEALTKDEQLELESLCDHWCQLVTLRTEEEAASD